MVYVERMLIALSLAFVVDYGTIQEKKTKERDRWEKDACTTHVRYKHHPSRLVCATSQRVPGA